MIKMKKNAAVSSYLDLSKGIFVTGEYGDQMFGSILMEGAYVPTPSFIFKGVDDPRVLNIRKNKSKPEDLKTKLENAPIKQLFEDRWEDVIARYIGIDGEDIKNN